MWTRLEGTDLWEVARVAHETPVGRKFHVFEHPLRLYEIAEMLNVPYDVVLDKAILLHDAVYEGKPDDVRRSADLLLTHDPSAQRSADLIMTTETHAPSSDNRLVLLDLHDLGDVDRALRNRDLIREEFMALKGISAEAYDAGSTAFMQELRDRIVEGVQSARVHRDDLDAFSRILRGMAEVFPKPQASDFSM